MHPLFGVFPVTHAASDREDSLQPVQFHRPPCSFGAIHRQQGRNGLQSWEISREQVRERPGRFFLERSDGGGHREP